MEREKLYNLYRRLKDKIRKKEISCSGYLFAASKFDRSKFHPFRNQNVQLLKKWSYVNCRAFHAAACCLFRFFKTTY